MKKTIYFLLFTGLIAIISCQQSDDTIEVPETVKDIDGNVYQTVTIGTQVWMVENLKTKHYRNGDPIPNITEQLEWNGLSKTRTGAYCDYDNNPNNSRKYGLLYNYYVVADNRGITPEGWHVATDDDWDELESFVAFTYQNPAKTLASKSGWAISNEYGSIGYKMNENNETGFNALPSGRRVTGGFIEIGKYARWWGNTGVSNDVGAGTGTLMVALSYQPTGPYYYYWFYSNGSEARYNGYAIRCVKD
jgi:uncharacterized protein (TIGR02145 family)